jgi:hypothetical protein
MQVNRQRHTLLAICHWIGQSVDPTAEPDCAGRKKHLCPCQEWNPDSHIARPVTHYFYQDTPGEGIKFGIRENKVYRK